MDVPRRYAIPILIGFAAIPVGLVYQASPTAPVAVAAPVADLPDVHFSNADARAALDGTHLLPDDRATFVPAFVRSCTEVNHVSLALCECTAKNVVDKITQAEAHAVIRAFTFNARDDETLASVATFLEKRAAAIAICRKQGS
jgi:hypothetical protein